MNCHKCRNLQYDINKEFYFKTGLITFLYKCDENRSVTTKRLQKYCPKIKE